MMAPRALRATVVVNAIALFAVQLGRQLRLVNPAELVPGQESRGFQCGIVVWHLRIAQTSLGVSGRLR